MPQTKPTSCEKLLRLGDVMERTALSRSSIYKKIKDGEFPSPIKVGIRASRWQETAIDIWIDRKVNYVKI